MVALMLKLVWQWQLLNLIFLFIAIISPIQPVESFFSNSKLLLEKSHFPFVKQATLQFEEDMQHGFLVSF